VSNLPALAAIDWSLDGFSLWLMSREGAVLASRKSDQGLALGRRDGFKTILEGHLSDLSAPDDLPVIICGLAGSRQGWRQTAYLETPANLDRLAESATNLGGPGRAITLLPGIAHANGNEPDVMRGDEVRLFGAVLEADNVGICCLPGLHSRWVSLGGRVVKSFRTFMTGELRNAAAGSTILKYSLEVGAEISAVDPAFLTGVRDGWLNAGRLTHLLFSLRADDLLNGRTGAETRARLTGLLIGAEVAGADLSGAPEVTLVASGEDAKLYLSAFDTCGISARLIDAELSTQRGLYEIWRQQSRAKE